MIEITRRNEQKYINAEAKISKHYLKNIQFMHDELCSSKYKMHIVFKYTWSSHENLL